MAILSPANNHLLAALPAFGAAQGLPGLELEELKSGQVLYETGDRPQHVYFPVDCIISLLNVMTDGAITEVASVGNEGILGITVITGGQTTLGRAVVQCPGFAYRLSAEDIKQEFKNNASLQALLLRYTQCLITQLAQTAACYRHHSLKQQLCRWLLTSMDRLPSSEIFITQEIIANALGVRRGGINEATTELERLGIVMHSRGHVRVVDRVKLEALCCECYTAVRRESARLMRWDAADSRDRDLRSVNDL